ncbi:MAG: phage holin family protein [Candidatus Harrisonbacteria bacterium]|nr:phage holin family protein [Candidatus Harrisonbacteria bacterium]
MKLISHFIFSFFSNFITLLIAGNFISGFEISDNLVNLAVAAAIFMLINTYLRPLIKMVLSPLVFLTLGLFTLVINAGMLYLLDILSENVTIRGIESLIYGTLLITGVNFLLHFSAKHLAK